MIFIITIYLHLMISNSDLSLNSSFYWFTFALIQRKAYNNVVQSLPLRICCSNDCPSVCCKQLLRRSSCKASSNRWQRRRHEQHFSRCWIVPEKASQGPSEVGFHELRQHTWKGAEVHSQSSNGWFSSSFLTKFHFYTLKFIVNKFLKFWLFNIIESMKGIEEDG